MVQIFRSNNRMVIFSKTEKRIISQETYVRDHTFMTSTWKRGGGGLKICQVFPYFFLFLNKRSIVYFCKCRGLRVTQSVIFCGLYECITTKWFKTTTYSVVRASIFFFNIKPDKFWLP